MRHAFTLALLVLACTTSFAASHQRWNRINCGTCVQTLVDDVNDCSDLRVVFNDREAVRAEEMVTVGEARSLTIRAPQSGGIYVRGTESSRFSVKACKAVEFGELLANVHVNVNGENMTATGPNASGWIVYFLVDMPRAARGDFATSNGPVQIRDVDGSIVARAQNGPVSAKNTRGSIDLRAQNGPVAFSGSSGDIVLRTDNGPISVELLNTFWERGTLDARTGNGPVSLRLPRGYRSGVAVETEGRSPVNCHAADCRDRRMKYDDDSSNWPAHIDLGSGPVAVTIATHNGPVTIDER